MLGEHRSWHKENSREELLGRARLSWLMPKQWSHNQWLTEWEGRFQPPSWEGNVWNLFSWISTSALSFGAFCTTLNQFMVLPQHCICCFLQPWKIILEGCRDFCPEVLCSMVVYLLDCKKCSLQPLGYLSTKSVFIRAESMAELQVSLCISQPTEQKGTWCPSMGGWLTGMLLSPVLPSDLAVLVPGNQSPPTLVCAKQPWLECQGMQLQRAGTTGLHVSRGSPCCSDHPFLVFFV